MNRYSQMKIGEKESKALEIIGNAITEAVIFGKSGWQAPITDEQAMQIAHFAKQGVKVRLK